MTDAHRRQNLLDEVARGERCLEAAAALVGLGLHADAVTRAYFGAFHFLRALLFARGAEPRTHAGALHLFNLELVRTGAMSSSHDRLIGGPQRARELADDDAAVAFTAADAEALLADARACAADARALLAREGWVG